MLLDMSLLQLETLLLIMVRVTGIFVVSPFFGNRQVPALFKIGLSFYLAFLIFVSLAPSAVPSQNMQGGMFIVSVLKEWIVGLLIGYVSSLVFASIQIAGQIIDTQIGLGISSVIDPQTGFQSPLIGNFQNLLALLLFIGMDGHHGLIAALLQSFQFLPIGEFTLTGTVLDLIFRTFSYMFVLAIKISAPVIAALFLTDVAMAVMAKTVPQMNIFVVGMPAKLIAGLLMLLFAMSGLVLMFNQLFDLMFQDIDHLLRLLGGLP